VAFWSQEVLLPEGDIFPYRLERLECFRPPQPAGTRLECRVYVRHVDEMVIHSDIEICDAGGNLHYRLKSWEDRRFRLPAALWRLRIEPRTTLLSAPWNDVLRPEYRGRGVVCCRLADIPGSLLEMSHGIWLEMLAAMILSRREREHWRGMTAATDKRRIDWLLGRAAAKDAIRLLVKQLKGADVCAADVEILAGPDGRPVVSGAVPARFGIEPQVSIAHGGSHWLALASPSGADLVGVDVESVDRDVDAIQSLAFGEQERRLLGGFPSADRPEWTVRLWCAKEAAAKALGRGLSRGLESVRGAAIRPDEGLIEIEIGTALLAEFPELAGERLSASTIRENGVVCSALVWRRRGL
jgi:phosphopantetheinyl transferase